MKGCGKDEDCQKEKWEKEKYNAESLTNVDEAQNTYGPQRAKEKSLQIADSIGTLMSVQCATTTCESYKTALLERSIESYEHLSKVLNEWAPTLDRLGLIGGAAAGKQGSSRPAGVPEREGLAQVQKAVEYLGTVKVTVAKGFDKLFEAGRTSKASELKQYAEAQGWKPSQTDGGPFKYVDQNGIPRVTIKQGSSRAPGSADPHVELKDATGQRTDAFGNPVTRKSPGNHTSIDFDL